jgi:hypothetical protein
VVGCQPRSLHFHWLIWMGDAGAKKGGAGNKAMAGTRSELDTLLLWKGIQAMVCGRRS